ncbi:hypothetical protein DFA_06356 [Cavenderia fasciculata]|uniref:Ubiquitin-like domain-containing protein n=1 Tax=Cavenderia fasciculata TaxID=261658 RepID=F4PKT5_CACFS|nr:uncharacterized protein DFA_06356 [Cavenderia fasciculata]EGG24209.1 hypothetical protein DFA_06356 [Cavenderia fasciculata]|eukprot:XP_004362060.1 hypothetical protein DFA_06356 [Cavenderia fasciculata]
MKVHCPTLEKTIDIQVEDNDKLIDVKHQIYDKTGTPPAHQLLGFEGSKVFSKRNDKKKISSLHLDNNSNITMIYSMAGGCDCCGIGCDICGCGGNCRCSIL